MGYTKNEMMQMVEEDMKFIRLQFTDILGNMVITATGDNLYKLV